ncbi:DUF2497 domain-containing protein [Aquabacter cavernae]|uniref:DUF2497 domain-containing protein n=1 Tax=Aquabacter cavernae TaxID=2496029 RepID=UPI0013DF8CA1|nr:DUF2497 domain-containing protein [Aquabacter cavernae]
MESRIPARPVPAAFGDQTPAPDALSPLPAAPAYAPAYPAIPEDVPMADHPYPTADQMPMGYDHELTGYDHAPPAYRPVPELAPRPAPRSFEPVRSAEPYRAPEPARRKELLSPDVDAAVAAAFGTLGDLVVPAHERTIEDLVKEILRPMLKTWLDDNLPRIVDDLVRQEIERISRSGR